MQFAELFIRRDRWLVEGCHWQPPDAKNPPKCASLRGMASVLSIVIPPGDGLRKFFLYTVFMATEGICSHGLRTMAASAANPLSWYGRILFPLFHTSAQARNPKNGRPDSQQRADWRKLRAVWEQVLAQHGVARRIVSN